MPAARFASSVPRVRRASTSRVRLLATLLLATLAFAAAGCGREPEPVRDSRETLGTVVTVSAYAEDEDAKRATDAAYAAMADVESFLDAHDPSSAVAKFNADPYTPQTLPAAALDVLRAVEDLGVGEWFSPSLLGVVTLYDFEGGGRVPDAEEIEMQVRLANTFGMQPPGQSREPSSTWAFLRPKTQPQPAPPGLDFGGAAKGLALDEAARVLAGEGVQAALVSAGSTTVAFGEKPDGEPWRVGVEDPRNPEEIVATVTAPRGIVLSTSGDYQRFFERNGVRYHHILDPRTGLPARGLRSLTVLGLRDGANGLSGLDSDILSTALFVAGREPAEAYARGNGLGLITVDAAGEVRVVAPPSGSGIEIELADE